MIMNVSEVEPIVENCVHSLIVKDRKKKITVFLLCTSSIKMGAGYSNNNGILLHHLPGTCYSHDHLFSLGIPHTLYLLNIDTIYI